jgi:hypothetical protein
VPLFLALEGKSVDQVEGHNPWRGLVSEDSTPNVGSSSATWRWKKVRITGAAQPRNTARRHAARWRGRVRRDPGEWLPLRIKYTGGPEAWCVVDARGVVAAFPGHRALYDVLMEICNAQ